MGSGYDEQKEEPVQPPTILQGGPGWAERCAIVPSSAARWFQSDSALLPMQDAARINLLDSVFRSTVPAHAPLSAPIMRSSELIYSH